jgi:hypothetical protein
MNSKYVFAMAALAALCLFVAPALCLPGDSGGKNGGVCPMMASLNLTPEEMGNMTLGELKELEKEARNSSASCPSGQRADNCNGSAMGKDASCGPNGKMQMGGRDGGRDGFGNQDGRMMGDGKGPMNNAGNGPNMNAPCNNSARSMDGSAGMFGMNGEKRDGKHSGDNGIFGSLSLLLWDGNITMDQLNEMTISQIRELKQSKMQEMDGMTLNQIDELREKKKQEMNNMTMDDLSAKKESIRQISRIFNALDTETETVSAQA